MCKRCEGYSEEEVQRSYDLTIKVHGFVRLQIQNPTGSDWTYTMGLAENFGHPDLLCVQIEPAAQADYIHAVGAMVVDEGLPDPGELDELDLELVPVHPCHLQGGLVAMWVIRYGRLPVEGDFLQVVPGPSHFCECHGSSMQRLDDPEPLRLAGPNRAARRAQRRANRRRGRGAA
jgi:hypothetical protein